MRYARGIYYKGETFMTASGLSTFLFVAGALLAGAIAQAQQAQQASQASQASQDSKSAAATTATAASSTAASQPAQKADDKAATAQAEAAKKAADQLVKDARNAGFKPEQVRGALMFCRTATELGSSFPVRTCYNEDQVRIKIEEYRTERNQLQSTHSSGMITN